VLLPRTYAHAIDAPKLGEYAALVLLDGERAADSAFPEITAHLATGCQRCAADLREMQIVLADEFRSPPDKELP
jgi:hypothetical protein